MLTLQLKCLSKIVLICTIEKLSPCHYVIASSNPDNAITIHDWAPSQKDWLATLANYGPLWARVCERGQIARSSNCLATTIGTAVQKVSVGWHQHFLEKVCVSPHPLQLVVVVWQGRAGWWVGIDGWSNWVENEVIPIKKYLSIDIHRRDLGTEQLVRIESTSF